MELCSGVGGWGGVNVKSLQLMASSVLYPPEHLQQEEEEERKDGLAALPEQTG